MGKLRGQSMNTINSIILEGNIRSIEMLEEVAKVVISCVRYYKTIDGEETKEESLFEVRCYGHIAEVVNKIGKLDRGLRVVGRLKQAEGNIFIVAEHIEFKPKY